MAVVGAHDLDAELDLAGDLDPTRRAGAIRRSGAAGAGVAVELAGAVLVGLAAAGVRLQGFGGRHSVCRSSRRHAFVVLDG